MSTPVRPIDPSIVIPKNTKTSLEFQEDYILESVSEILPGKVDIKKCKQDQTLMNMIYKLNRLNDMLIWLSDVITYNKQNLLPGPNQNLDKEVMGLFLTYADEGVYSRYYKLLEERILRVSAD